MFVSTRRLWIGGIVTALLLVSPVASADDKNTTPPHWTVVAPLGEARTDHTATALLDNTTLAVGGGSTSSGPGVASCELWDPVARTWSPTAPLARARFAHTATRLNDGRVLVVGGFESFSLPLPTEVEIYDPVQHTWSPAAPIPVPRAFHSAILLNDGRVFVAGGDAPGVGDTATAYIYDPNTNAWSTAGSMSVAREPGRFGSILLANGDVFIAGGFQVTSGQSVAAADRYNVATGTWTTLPNLTEARNGNTLERLPDGRVFVIGGKNGGQIRSSTEIFDPSTNQFFGGPALGIARWAHTSANLGDGRILVMGGRTLAGDTASCEMFHLALRRWTPFAALGTKHFKFGSTMTAGVQWFAEALTNVRRVTVVGGFDGTAAANVVEEIVIPVGPATPEPQ
jgi:hypothetical protein